MEAKAQEDKATDVEPTDVVEAEKKGPAEEDKKEE